jgi:superfamily II RNA helicase
MSTVPRLTVPASTDADEVYAAYLAWAEAQGLTLYPHQDEAIIEVLSGAHVVLATPTGSGKTLVATAASTPPRSRRWSRRSSSTCAICWVRSGWAC